MEGGRKHLFSKGFRYRKNDKKLPGCPDIVFAKYKTVVFINGCFWHMHEGCSRAVWPKSNTDYWNNKLENNSKRDQNNYRLLSEMGYNVIIIWKCQLNKNGRSETLAMLAEKIKGGETKRYKGVT